MNLFETDTDSRLREQTYGCQGRMRGWDSQGVWDWHVHAAIFKMDLIYSTGNSAQCDGAAWRREFGGEWIRVCVVLMKVKEE